MMVEWKQERPGWCVNTNCIFIGCVQDSACIGQLPKPTPHDGDFNTHGLCIVLDEVISLYINKGDIFHLKRLLDMVKDAETDKY